MEEHHQNDPAHVHHAYSLYIHFIRTRHFHIHIALFPHSRDVGFDAATAVEGYNACSPIGGT